MLLRCLSAVSVAAILPAAILDHAKRAFDSGDYRTSATLFEKVHQQSKSCDVLFYLGLSQHRLKETEKALIAFKSAVQCDPKLTPAHLALAQAYGARGNENEALTAYLAALKLAPGNPGALRGAAAIYLRNQTHEKALPLLEKLVEVEPTDPQALIDLAATHAASGDQEKRKRDFRRRSGCSRTPLLL